MAHQEPSLVITDDRKQLWLWAEKFMRLLSIPCIRLPSTFKVPESQDLIAKAPYLLIHWESNRFGGGLIEEILDQHPQISLDRVMIMTTAPTREDIIYFSELSLKNIFHFRWTQSHLTQTYKQFQKAMSKPTGQPLQDHVLRRVHKYFKLKKPSLDTSLITAIEEHLQDSAHINRASVMDFEACLHWIHGHPLEAHHAWEKAHEQNPQYPHTLEHQFLAFRQQQDYKQARNILKKLHQLNRNRASRWIDLGDTHIAQDNFQKAEGCFMEAMQRDPHNQRFSLMYANLKFLEGEYETAKKFAAKATSTKELASLLNSQGIEMVQRGEYEMATKHYEKALLVLKNDQKSASIFYNLSLCLYRQGHYGDAAELAHITLVKEPGHEKALRLLSNLQQS